MRPHLVIHEVFISSFLLNVGNAYDNVNEIAGGRLFQTCSDATGNGRSPIQSTGVAS